MRVLNQVAFAVLVLILPLGTFASNQKPEDSEVVERVVANISCKSMAPLNRWELGIAEMGKYPFLASSIDHSENRSRVFIKMVNNDSTYKSGMPPCPKGDELIIDLVDPLLSY